MFRKLQATRVDFPTTNFLTEKSLKDSSREKLLYSFFKERRVSYSKKIATLPSNTTLKNLFVKYSSTIRCSAAIECLFSFGEDVRKPEQFELSDGHFEMLVLCDFFAIQLLLLLVLSAGLLVLSQIASKNYRFHFT